MLDKNISISEKTDKYIEKFPELIDSKDLIEKSMKDKSMAQKLKSKIHGLSYKSLINTKIDLDKRREGASYIGSFDLNELKKFSREILLYKFKYVMNTIPRFTKNLTGYIENKCFIDELFNIMFSTPEEKEVIHRHTVVKELDTKKEYYMIFTLNISSDYKYIYCFYNSKTKEIEMPIEPFDFMRRNQMRPLKESTLNQEIARSIKNSELNFINYDVDKEEYTQKRA